MTGPATVGHDEAAGVADHLDRVLALALEEDLGGPDPRADVTTVATVAEGLRGEAVVRAKADGILCGLGAIGAVCRLLAGPDAVEVQLPKRDGDAVVPGEVVARLHGDVATILTGERTALNLLGHLSGTATLVASFLRSAPGATLVDTRKTLPGLRALQKYAVRCGGGANHRFGLWDGVLVKDNHIVAAGGIAEAVRKAKTASSLPVQAECTTPDEAVAAVEAGADALLVDNLGPERLRAVVERVRGLGRPVLIEASGGVNLDTVAPLAATGVDRISVGAFTHSAPALDVSLTLERVRGKG